jgi:hypothetical protein
MSEHHPHLTLRIHQVIAALRRALEEDTASATVAAWEGNPEIGAMHLARAQAYARAITDLNAALDDSIKHNPA